MRGLVWVVLLAGGCSPGEEPPGRSATSGGELSLPRPTPPSATPSATGAPRTEPGGGARLASIAMRTWIYVAPDDRSTKLGYLRAGAVVPRGDEPVGTDGCAGGWYRIAPRGHVCVGKGASLAVDHQVVQAATRGPERGAPNPYRYVISKYPPPHMYFRLPSRRDQERTEGSTLAAHLASAGRPSNIGPIDPVPEFLAAGRDLPKPYGAEEKLHYSVHAGRAKESSAFGLATVFDWTGRLFGLTTELDLIPVDRTRPAPVSAFHGAIVPGPEGIPALLGKNGGASRYRADGRGGFREDGYAMPRSAFVLTGRAEQGMMETVDGFWLASDSLLVPDGREDPAGFARSGRKWIDVSIKKQMLVAYEGKRPVFATLVSTGIGELGDPETTHATVRGTFLIHSKHVSATMDGDEASDAFDLRDVPYVQYFHEGYALHGAYWHDDFGKARSHGCVNLAPADAAWLFDWTDPVVPAEWHGAVTAEGGTLVYTHP